MWLSSFLNVKFPLFVQAKKARNLIQTTTPQSTRPPQTLWRQKDGRTSSSLPFLSTQILSTSTTASTCQVRAYSSIVAVITVVTNNMAVGPRFQSKNMRNSYTV